MLPLGYEEMTLQVTWQECCRQYERIKRHCGHPSNSNQVQELGRDTVPTMLTLHPAITGIDNLCYTRQQVYTIRRNLLKLHCNTCYFWFHFDIVQPTKEILWSTSYAHLLVWSVAYCNRPWRPIAVWDVEAPTFSRQSAHRWRWGCQPYAPAALYLQEDSWYSVLLSQGFLG
jgi:hypothetical protein